MIATLAPPPICVVKSFYSSLAPLPKLALGAAVALGALSLSTGAANAACDPASPANTCRVTVGGLQYDVTRFTGSYNADTSKFAPPPAPGVMPWWGAGATASQFATQVGNYFGNQQIGGLGSVYFAYSYDSANSKVIFSTQYQGTIYYPWDTLDTDNRDWAQATLYSSPAASVPGPLPLFGAGAALGFCRRLSRRSKRLRHGVTSRRA
jgi:hypothetical protein